MRKLLLLLLLPQILLGQTSHGRISSDRLSNKATVTITGTTPDISGGNVFVTANGGPTTITNFLNPVDSQVITIVCGDLNTSVADNSNIASFGGFTCTTKAIVQFIYYAGLPQWIRTTAVIPTPSSLPLPNAAVYYQGRAILGNTMQTIGDVGTGSVSAGTGATTNGQAPTASDGIFNQLSSGVNSNSVYGYLPASGANFRAGRNCRYQARSRFPAGTDISGAQVWAGFTDQSPDLLRPTISLSSNMVAILSDFGTWKGVIYSGGAITSIVLTATPDTVSYTLDIAMNDTANTTTFSINGIPRGVITGHNPTGINWWPTFAVLNAISSGILVRQNLEYIYAQQDF